MDVPVEGLAMQIAATILNGFNRHFSIFSKITKGAKERFENADWDAERTASRERIKFYDIRVRDSTRDLQKLFDLETAVHKMTGLTASRFGLENRGIIAIGNYADLVLFDPATIIDRASFEDPTQFSDGIISVWVNGKLSWHEQKSGGIRNGRFLTR